MKWELVLWGCVLKTCTELGWAEGGEGQGSWLEQDTTCSGSSLWPPEDGDEGKWWWTGGSSSQIRVLIGTFVLKVRIHFTVCNLTKTPPCLFCIHFFLATPLWHHCPILWAVCREQTACDSCTKMKEFSKSTMNFSSTSRSYYYRNWSPKLHIFQQNRPYVLRYL